MMDYPSACLPGNAQRSGAGYNSLQHWVMSIMCYHRSARRGCFWSGKKAAYRWVERWFTCLSRLRKHVLVKSWIPQRLISVTTPIFSLGKLRSEMLFDLPKVMHKLVVEPETRPKRPRFLSLPQRFQLQMQKCCRPVVQKEPITRLQDLYQPQERSNSPVVKRHPRTAACLLTAF